MKINLGILGTIIVVIGGFALLFAFAPRDNEPSLDNQGLSTAIPADQFPESGNFDDVAENVVARNTCVNHGPGVSMHIHPELRIFIDDTQVDIPANVGIDAECMRALYMHEANGEIHIEFPTSFDFTLGDFFANWGETFTDENFMGNILDETHVLFMKVNGEDIDVTSGLVLKDEDQIEIRYTTLSEDGLNE